MSLQRRSIEVGGNHAMVPKKRKQREKESSQQSRMLLRCQETWQAERHPLDLETWGGVCKSYVGGTVRIGVEEERIQEVRKWRQLV